MAVLLQPFRVDPKSFHELIVQPTFGDTLGTDGGVLVSSPEEGDWMIVDSQRHEMPILDLVSGANILKRRDATCKLIYSPVAKLANRTISDVKLYAATEDCGEEFYQGSFDDYSNQNFEVFGQHIMPIMEKAVSTDLYTNKWFGNVTRLSDVNGKWSWNKFDGIFQKYQNYVANGVVTTSPLVIPADPNPAQVFALLKQMVAAQDDILQNFDDSDKAIYVDKKLYDLLGDYYTLAGIGFINLAELQAGRASLYVQGIEVRWKKWAPVLKALGGGTVKNAAILTLKGNFLYKTDSTYGGGVKRNEALRVWWSDDDNTWKRQAHLRGGTEIAAPQHSVLAWTAGLSF